MRKRMTVAVARRKWGTRRKRFVVGYVDSGNTLYGGHPIPGNQPLGDGITCTDPLSFAQARRTLQAMPSPGCVIFKLTPIQVNR